MSAWEINVSEFVKTIDFSLKCAKKNVHELDSRLFAIALTHSSYAVDNNLGYLNSNERLEFYGDSVLKLSCSQFLYDLYPDADEGVLSSYRAVLVSDLFLAKYVKEINLDKFIFVSDRPDLKTDKAYSTICACAFESVLGAFYIEVGIEPVYEFLKKIFERYLPYVKENILRLNAKATLQEYTQGQNKMLPVYSLVSELGKEHNKVFLVEVSYQNKVVGQGRGKSKKEAEQAAAYDACIKLGVINE